MSPAASASASWPPPQVDYAAKIESANDLRAVVKLSGWLVNAEGPRLLQYTIRAPTAANTVWSTPGGRSRGGEGTGGGSSCTSALQAVSAKGTCGCGRRRPSRAEGPLRAAQASGSTPARRLTSPGHDQRPGRHGS